MLQAFERPSTTRTGGSHWLAVGAVVLIIGVALARIDSWLLEADQSRIYFEAWGRATNADIPSRYLERTSWLYISLLTLLLRSGVSIETLPMVSSLLGAIAFVGLFFGLRRMTEGEHPMQLAVLYVLVPGLGLISMNGYPTILAAAVAVAFAALPVAGRRNLVVGAAYLSVALLLKADILLTFPGLFFWKLAQASGSQRERVRLGARWLVTMSAAFVPLAIVQLTRGQSGEFASSWSESFPFTLDAISQPGNWANVAAPGLGTLVLVAIGAVNARKRKAGEWEKWAAAAVWIAGPVVFWGLIVGNSTRHIVPTLAPIVWAANRAFAGHRLIIQVAMLIIAAALNISPGLVLPDPTFDGNTWQSARAIRSSIDTTRDNTAEVLRSNASAPEINIIDAANREYALFEFLTRHPEATLLGQRSRAYGDEDYMELTSFSADDQRVQFWYVPRNDLGLFIDVMIDRDRTPASVWSSSGTFQAPQLEPLATSG